MEDEDYFIDHQDFGLNLKLKIQTNNANIQRKAKSSN